MTPQGFTFAAAAQILDIPETKLRYWSQVGFVGPSRRQGRSQVFTFADLVSVRAAKELVERGFQPAHIRRALETVRATLPSVDRPLDRLRVAFDGDALVVLDDGAAYEVTGQRLFDFGVAEIAARAGLGAAVVTVPARPPERSAYDWFQEGLRQEDAQDDDAAVSCYRAAIASDAALAAAHTNLGALFLRRDDLESARTSLDAALACDPEQPEARYNLATVLFQMGDVALAASELRRVVLLAPRFADAHYNLATALERLGSKRQAREHLERYLELAAAGEAGDNAPWIDEAKRRLARL